MLLRAILSWFPIDNGFIDFLYAITEPFVYPFTRLFEKLGWFQGIPINMAFMVSYLVISIATVLLS